MGQVVMETVFEDIYGFENFTGGIGDIQIEPMTKDEAWAGAETSDGGLLVVGAIDNQQAFITRYTFTNTNNVPYGSIKYTKLLTGWTRIMDIKAIGGNKYVIVGLRDGGSFTEQTHPGISFGRLGIAFIRDLGPNNPEIFQIEEFLFIEEKDEVAPPDYATKEGGSSLIKNVSAITSKLTTDDLILFEESLPSGVVVHFDKRLNNVYSVVFSNPEDTGDVNFILNFSHNPLYGFKVEAVSHGYHGAGLRLPHAIAACGDQLVIAGQGPNPPSGQNSPNNQIVVASWSKDDLTFTGAYAGADQHKPKMVACAGPQGKGILVPGSFYSGDNQTMGLAYFPHPLNLDDYIGMNSPPTPYYFDDPTDGIPALGWPAEAESYAQAIAPTSSGGYILAGQSGSSPEVMVAMLVEPNVDYTAYSITDYTEAFDGNGTGDSFANYVIELTPTNGNLRKFALFGRANWTSNQGNIYVVIVEEKP